jgi:uncharacterized protein YeaO (DUF488 family)
MNVRKLLIITTLLIVSGCTYKFAYRNLDWLAYWYIDDFILLTTEQKTIVDQKLEIWLAWHKQKELPRYLANLNELTTDISMQQLNLEKLSYHQEAIRQHWVRMKAKLIPDLVLMAPLLDKQQVSYLFDKLDKKNATEREEIEANLALSQNQQQNNAIKKYKKNLTRWLGKLTPEQKTLAEGMYSLLQSNDALWLEYRKRYQAELKTLFENADRGDDFSKKLSQLLMEPDVFRGDELNKINADNSVNFKSFLLNINTLATEKQRQKLIKEINKFARDADTLMQK